jgi:drug/metabolite transporter (DMT)-like permease
MMHNQKLVNWVMFILLSLIWGSSFILMKWSRQGLNGIQIGALRIFFAGLVFFPFAIAHVATMPRRKIPLVLLSGLLGNLLPAFLFAIAIDKKIDSSLAGILNSLTPLLVVVLGALFFKTGLEQKKLAGVLIGFAGLLLLTLAKGGISLQNGGYALLIVLATVLYAVNVHLASRYLKDLNPLKMATVSLAGMAIPAAIVALQQDAFAPLWQSGVGRQSIGAVALLGIMGSAVATVLFYALIKRAGALFASLVTYGIPVVALGWGLIDQEPVSGMQVACLVLILTGVWVANKKKTEKTVKTARL